MTDYLALYKNNESFKTFVNKAAKADGESVEVELTKAVIKNVGDYYIERGEIKHPVTTISNGGGC